MKNILLTLHFCLLSIALFAQMENNREKIDQAKQDLNRPFSSVFAPCLLKQNCSDCIDQLLQHNSDAYTAYLLGGILYSMDADASFELHKEAYLAHPNELNFNLEYAIELHRKGNYKAAIPLYLTYQQEATKDYRIDVWLAECYINIGEHQKSIEHWKLANPTKNHSGIDKAIHTLHGRTDQLQMRSDFRKGIALKNEKNAYDLIFLDLNWEIDWWNTTVQDYFIEEDMNLIRKSFGSDSQTFKGLEAYKKIKQFAQDPLKKDSIESAFVDAELIVNNHRFLPHGKASSDLIGIALLNNVIDAKTMFDNRKDEILELAEHRNEVEFLNIYAHLESTIEGHVSPAIDKKGWLQFKDERFATSYFVGLAEKNRYSNPELDQALIDFPHSANLHSIKFKCALMEDKNHQKELIQLIQKEFKTLESDPYRYSYKLKEYFYLLENGI